MFGHVGFEMVDIGLMFDHVESSDKSSESSPAEEIDTGRNDGEHTGEDNDADEDVVVEGDTEYYFLHDCES